MDLGYAIYELQLFEWNFGKLKQLIGQLLCKKKNKQNKIKSNTIK